MDGFTCESFTVSVRDSVNEVNVTGSSLMIGFVCRVDETAAADVAARPVGSSSRPSDFCAVYRNKPCEWKHV